MLKVIIVGIGGYGRTLSELLLANQERLDYRLVAAADTRLGSLTGGELAAADALRQQGAQLYQDAQTMFDAWRGRADVAYIATAIASHEPLAVAAMQAGFHLHLEKPPAATVQEVDRMLEVSRRTGRMVLVGFQAVHGLDLQGLKQQILEGRLGTVHHLSCWAGWPRDRKYYTRNAWAGKLRSGDRWVLDGPATNALAHQITNLLFLAGPSAHELADPVAVRAELYAAGAQEAHDTAGIEIVTAQGPPAYFLATHCPGVSKPYGPTITIVAEGGSAVWNSEQGAVISYADGTAQMIAPDREPRPRMLGNLMDAVRAGGARVLRCPLEQARKMVLVGDGAHDSSGRVHRIGPQYCRASYPGTDAQRTLVLGIDDAMLAAGRRPGLFSDLPEPPPWSVPTASFDLAGYRAFPQRFGRPGPSRTG